ncbi:hypothetical protein LTT02_21885 [Mycolicibacterium smegmatis]|uniref:hypothetical protein n=1 Tax=Mycolicibacterium smegmatis TaxID=1772 RepID=UPI0005D9F7B6|nr:hypothetical protein [Mycolicibacterium smegmatis]MDF1899716.1 hypothetical protein [Mycolicibacterium smegmatis]MDF1905504.1 hypothetical protein [Mycolicibacterium smegmatis]MDF1917897.1 hypothetical protein [Mycolicibacterium smegmatis]MDF1924547.1 hypothetical protein [Mycolicibacterium smegmatis]UAK57721.1 hypothetical protein K8P01_13905 [Mycolicibacterium smegmatis]
MTISDTKTPARQDNPPDSHTAGENAPTGTDDDHTPTSELDETTQNQDEGGRANREARYRRERNEARRELDELRDTLQRTRAAIVENAVQAAGLDPRLLTAAGHTVDSLVGDDGLIDGTKLSEAVTATAREFRVPPKGRPPQPNRQQGTGSGQPPGKASWSKALKGR